MSTPSSTDTAEAVLNDIRDALESRGYFHMANGRDIGLLLDEGTKEIGGRIADRVRDIEAAEKKLADAVQALEVCRVGFQNLTSLTDRTDLEIQNVCLQKIDWALCSDCPPIGYSTDKTRCDPCPRAALTCLARNEGDEPQIVETWL